nr:hypothetical protein [Tanacetum cinerariifolium]
MLFRLESKEENITVLMNDIQKSKWLNAMNVEMQSMKDNEVWVLVELPPNGKTVGTCFFRDGLRKSASHLSILTDSIILILVLSSLAEPNANEHGRIPLAPMDIKAKAGKRILYCTGVGDCMI